MKDTIVEVTKDLMSFHTYYKNKNEFKKLFDYIRSRYSNLVIHEYEFDGKKCMVLSNFDTKNFDLVFCCHCDVVFTDSWDILEDNENLYGRGSIDMKGGLAVCLEALKNSHTKKNIGLFVTTDEEIDGFTCQKLLEIYHAGFAIIPDGGKNFQLIKEEKGLLQLELSLKTHSSHASQPWNGVNAIDQLYSIYQELLKNYPLPKNSNDYITSINLSAIEGGDSFNRVPDTCMMKLDIRYTSDTNKKKLLNEIKKISSNVRVQVVFESSIFICDMKDRNVLKYLDISKDVVGKEIEVIGCESSSDAVYFYDKKIPTVIMNPIGDYPHGEKEYVSKDSLYTLFLIYQRMIEEVV